MLLLRLISRPSVTPHARPFCRISNPVEALGLPLREARMRRFMASVAFATILGCAGNPVRSMSAPAPTGALECTIRTMAGLGYTPVRGGINDGYVTFERTYNSGLLGRNLMRATVTATQAGEQLRVTVVSYDEKGRAKGANSETLGHAEAMMASCGHPQHG